MIVRSDIVQGTPEWHELRWRKVGGTRSGQLIKQSDALLIEMVSEFAEEFEVDEDGYYSNDMLLGIELEPEARKQLSEYIGQELVTSGWWQSELYPLLGISPDGHTPGLTIACETKCPARKKHTKTILEDEIPSDNIEQCVHYFTVNPKLEKLYFCSFRPESIKPLFVKCLTRESKVDLGFTIKGKVKEDRGYGMKEYVETLPDLRTINEWVDLAHNNTILLDAQIKSKINQLKF